MRKESVLEEAQMRLNNFVLDFTVHPGLQLWHLYFFPGYVCPGDPLSLVLCARNQGLGLERLALQKLIMH